MSDYHPKLTLTDFSSRKLFRFSLNYFSVRVWTERTTSG